MHRALTSIKRYRYGTVGRDVAWPSFASSHMDLRCLCVTRREKNGPSAIAVRARTLLGQPVERGVESGHVDRLRRGEVPREAEARAHHEGLAELAHTRERGAAHAEGHEREEVAHRRRLALGQQHVGHLR